SPCVSVAKHTNIRSFPTRRSSDLSVIGAILAFGLGVGVLLLWLYDGRASNKFGILVGQIVAIDSTDLVTFLVASGVVLLVLAVVYRPLLFASVDPAVEVGRASCREGGGGTGWVGGRE